MAVRDTLSGFLRWSLHSASLDLLWFIPDLFVATAAGWFVWHHAVTERSPWAALLTASLVMSLGVALIYLSSDGVFVVTAIKMVLPLVAGAAMGGRTITDTPWVRRLLVTLLIVGVAGVWWSSFVRPPWVDFSFEVLGVERTAGRLWWINERERFGGFAIESTTAAATVFFTLVVLHRQFSRSINLLLWAAVYSAIVLTTSRSAQVAALLFLAYFLVVYVLLGASRSIEIPRRIAAASYSLAVVPFVLVFLFAGARLGDAVLELNSLQMRIDDGWQVPFSYLWSDFPLSILTGCGLGCYTYPMKLTPLAGVKVPIDNFYVASILMFGLPFAVLAVGFVIAALRGLNPTKLVLVTMLNIYLITVEGYSPSFVTMLFGYAISDLFLQAKRSPVLRLTSLPQPA